MKKFTKGPWIFYYSGGQIENDYGSVVCKVGDDRGHYEDAEVIAALITAAPEMYEMLDEISDGLLDAGGFGNCALAKRIEQLLAKARGEND